MTFNQEISKETNTIICFLKTDIETDIESQLVLKISSASSASLTSFKNYKINPIGGWEEWSYDKDYSWNVYLQTRGSLNWNLNYSFEKSCKENKWCEIGFSSLPFLSYVPETWNVIGIVEHPFVWISNAIKYKFHSTKGDGVSFIPVTKEDYAELWVLLTKKIIGNCKIFRMNDIFGDSIIPQMDVWEIVSETAEKLGYNKDRYSEYPPKSNVSVAIISHNYGHFLPECIDSVLNQTVKPEEIVIVDDSSTDNTIEVANSYGLNYIRCDHKSCFLSRKVGFFATKCRFLILLDADDKLGETYIQECLNVLERNPNVGICTTDMKLFGDYNENYVPYVADINQSNWISSGALVRRVALLESKIFELNSIDDNICEDWFMWKKVMKIGWKSHKIKKCIYHYRKHGDSRSTFHKSTGNYYTWAGLSLEPITVLIKINEIDDWNQAKIWLSRNTISELIVVDGTNDEDLRKEINSYSVIYDSYIYISGASHDCLSKSNNEFIFVFDKPCPNDNVDSLLKQMNYEVMKISGDGCYLIRKSSLSNSNHYERISQVKTPLEVVIITPVLTVGGAELWLRMLVTMSDPSKVHWRVVLTGSKWNPITVNPIKKVADMYVVGDTMPEVKNKFVDANSAIKSACEGADIVITWSDNDWPLPTKLPIIMVSHGSCSFTKKVMDLAFLGGANYFAATSEESVITTCTPEMNTKIIWNSFASDRIVIDRDPDDVRINSLKVPKDWWYSDNIYVGFIGRMAVEKNLMTIVQAVENLPYQFKCCFIGDGEAVEETVNMATKILNNKFYYIPSVDDVGNYFNALDVMVSTSPNEGNSFALIEAMICGCPIVTTRVGAVAEFERNAGCELFISLPDFPTVNETALAIRKAVAEGRQASRVIAAKKFAEKYLNTKVMTNNWVDYLIEICNK